MKKVLLTWAYDGSGIALRIPAHVWQTYIDTTLLTIHTDNAEIVKALEPQCFYCVQVGCNEYEMRVPNGLLSPLDSAPAVESWNWND